MTTQKITQKIAILDFGGQYTQLIARRIREMGVYSEILPCTEPVERVLGGGYTGIVLSGGPSSVYEEEAPRAARGGRPGDGVDEPRRHGAGAATAGQSAAGARGEVHAVLRRVRGRGQ